MTVHNDKAGPAQPLQAAQSRGPEAHQTSGPANKAGQTPEPGQPAGRMPEPGQMPGPGQMAGRMPGPGEMAGRMPEAGEMAGRIPGSGETAGRTPEAGHEAARRPGPERQAEQASAVSPGLERWEDLARWQHVAIVGVAAAEFVLTVVAVADLVRRPRAGVRGPKVLWFVGFAVQPFGSLGYLVAGRRRGQGAGPVS